MLCTIHSQENTKYTIQTRSNGITEGTEIVYNNSNGNKTEQFLFRNNKIISAISNLALEVQGSMQPDSKIILSQIKDTDNQKFYFRKDGTIRTANGLCISIPNKSSLNSPLILSPANGKTSQTWVLNTNLA